MPWRRPHRGRRVSTPVRAAPAVPASAAGLVDVLLPGYIAMVMATGGLMSLPETVAGYRERGVLGLRLLERLGHPAQLALEVADLVTQAGGVLEAQVGGGLVHLVGQ